MAKLKPSMRLKVNRDTFYLPEPDSGVYFRNNACSFRMNGNGIDQWVEKLLPMFNGEHTLEMLTAGLPVAYQDRIFEIAEVLYGNGFVRDVTQDEPHQLPEQVRKAYAPQIEFVDSLAGSGAARFEAYRNSNVLAIGSGPFLNSLVSSLFESGLKKLHVAITEDGPTNRERIDYILTHVRKTDAEAEVIEMEPMKNDWKKLIQPFDSVLFVAQHGNLAEVRKFQTICEEEKIHFMPAVCLGHVGIAGPIVSPGSGSSWESAWRRLHRPALVKDRPAPADSFIPGALLANVMVFELFKTVTGITKKDEQNRIYLLDVETLEGRWHSFAPHPLETGAVTANLVENLETQLQQAREKAEPDKLLLRFSLLTSKETGIFHVWDEGDLKQLPLAQCRVQPVDPLSDGPAELLPEIVCSGMTHQEVRREAALAGIETYSSRIATLFVKDSNRFIGIGAGETLAECVARGLQQCLSQELECLQKPVVTKVQVGSLEDERSRFYLDALATMGKEPAIGFGEDVSGFPVVWARTVDGWFASAGLNATLALRNVLKNALGTAQNQSAPARPFDDPFINFDEKELPVANFPAYGESANSETISEAIEVLKNHQKKLAVYELNIEPAFRQELAGVFAVLLREEEWN
ncbi:putative thiazole-containing bacteriocin maturation protein [Bacillus sp. REN3]|uniref:putative thiazole-containing bacteriocin maturation protein n=1 Tax=Bacillus sp. REN3 TaxID=2802440 RepID=UPI001AEE5CB5|nr:putative thiazole-containing bacteriocin maturation protein [Bacillus sp. REN3]